MSKCKAKNCKSIPYKNPNVTFHKFPIFDQKLLRCWLDNISSPNYQPNPEDHICSLHFTDDQFMNTEPRRLIRYAVPTIILDDLRNIQNTKRTDRRWKIPKRKAVVMEEEETSDSDTEISSTDLSTSTSEDESEDNLPLTNRTDKRIKCNADTPRYVGDFKEEDFKCPERMRRMWDIAYKEITDQRIKLRNVTQKNKRLEGQVTRLKNIIRHLRSVHK